MTKLQDITTCLVVSFSTKKGWKQTTTDRQQSENICTATNAKSRSAKAVVKLFENEVTQAINSLIASTRKSLYAITLPTDDESKRLVPNSQFEEVASVLNGAEQSLGALKQKLASSYIGFMKNERERLGDLFNSLQYFSVDEVLAGTSITSSFEPLPDSSRFAELFSADSLVSQLTAEFEARLAKQKQVATEGLIHRLRAAAEYAIGIVDRYHAGGSRLRGNTLVEHVKLEASCCQKINLGDTEVDRQSRALLAALPGDPEVLKDQATADTFKATLRQAVGINVASKPIVVSAEEPAAEEPAAEEPAAEEPAAAEELVAVGIDDFDLLG